MKKSWFLLILSTLLFLPIKSLAAPTANPSSFSYLREASGINIIDPNDARVEVGGEYNFSLQLVSANKSTSNNERENSGTSYFAKGVSAPEDNSIKELDQEPYYTNNSSNRSGVYKFYKSNQEQFVYVRQAGFYMGQSIDIKINIDTSQMDKNSIFRVVAPSYHDRIETAEGIMTTVSNERVYDTFSNAFLYLGSTLKTSSPPTKFKQDHHKGVASTSDNTAFKTGDKVTYSYSFHKTEPLDTNNKIVIGAPINVTGLWNIDNANAVKYLTDLNGFTDFNKYYVYKSPTAQTGVPDNNSNNVWYKKDGNKLIFTGDNNIIDTSKGYGKISTSFTTMFENKNNLSYMVETKDYSGNARTALGIKYSRDAIPRVAPTEPYIIGLKNTADHTDQNNYTDLQYDIRFGVGSNDVGKRNDALSIQTETPEYYDIIESKIEVVNMIDGKTLLLNTDYTVEIDPTNKSKAKIIFKNTTTDDFNDGYFRISINAETNSKFDFAPDKYGYLNDSTSEDNGYMHFDLADNTILTYTHNDSGNVNKTLTSKKIDERSIAKVNYEGIPFGESKTGLTLTKGKKIEQQYPNASELIQDGFETQINTNNSRDLNVTASYPDKMPDTTNLSPGETVTIPITLTSALGVKTIVNVTLKVIPFSLNVEFRNEVGDLLSSVQKDVGYGDNIILGNIPDVVNELNKYLNSGEYIQDKTRLPEDNFEIDNTNNTQVYYLIGQVFIASAPDLFDFGNQEVEINPIDQKQAVNLDVQNPLTIKDKRANQSDGWTLYLRSSKEFTAEDGITKLPGILRYRLDDTNYFIVSSDSAEVYQKNTGGDYNISNDWSDNGAGLGIKIDSKDIKKLGTYSAEIEWVLMPDLTTTPVP